MTESNKHLRHDTSHVIYREGFLEARWRSDLNLVGKSHKPLDLDHETWWSVFCTLQEKYASKNCLGWREPIDKKRFSEYKWLTFSEVGSIVDRIGCALVYLGISVGENVGIFAPNRVEWMVSDFAMQRQGVVSVPLYATFGQASVVYILNHAEIKTSFCSKEMLKMIENALPQLKFLKRLICFDNIELTVEQQLLFSEHKIEFLTWTQCEKIGAEHNYPPAKVVNSDMYSIIYTSGTTGNPKGVVHTQQSVLAAIEVVTFYPIFENGLSQCVQLCYLPLAHVYSRVLAMAFLRGGACVGFFSGSVRNLFDDIAAINPTHVPSVPRVLSKIYDKVNSTVSQSSSLKKGVFNLALSAKTAAQENNTSTMINWDSIAFAKTRYTMGNRCKMVLSASAPLDPIMVPFLKAVICVPIYQAYGLTETFGGVCATNQMEKFPFSSTGSLLYGETFRLVDVPEMGYFTTDDPPKGEIYIKGKSNFNCYYRDPETTAEVLVDGWIRTDDIAAFDIRTESFSIIDRKKNIFKMAQGEFVSAERLEEVIVRDALIEQIWVAVETGDSFTVAVVVPEKEQLKILAEKLKIEYKSETELYSNIQIAEYLQQHIHKHGIEQGAQSYELPKAVHIESEPFSEENELLTPSFKLRRVALKKKYSKIIDALRTKVEAYLKEESKKAKQETEK